MSIEIPVKDGHKLMAADWAIKKQPPFHLKPNSVGDAVIFLSTVDYFSYDDEYYIDNTVFVSYNTSDFGSLENKKELHPKLAQMLTYKPIIYKTNLAEVLELGDEIIAKYELYLNYRNRDTISCLMGCKGAKYLMDKVLFEDRVEIEVDKGGYTYNPKQKLMDFGGYYTYTEEELKAMEKRRFVTVYRGYCDFCYATHIRCDCEEEHATYGDDIECGCGKIYSLKNGIELIEN